MTDFKIHDETTAPTASKETLKNIRSAFGFIPNAMGILADSPPVLNSYLSLDAAVKECELEADDIQVLILAISHENACHYCMAAHSMQAQMAKVGASELEKLRAGEAPENPRHRALADFARAMVRSRGWVGEDDVQAFLEAGFTKANIMDVVLVVAMKTITNYTNHITNVPLDDAFSDYRWVPEEAQKQQA